MPAIVAKKCGLIYLPPTLVIIYQVDGDTTPRGPGNGSKSRSPVKMRKHVIPLRLLLNDRTDIYELLQRLGETKEHGKFVKSVPVQQLVGLIELLQRKQRGENIESEIRKRRESLAQKNGNLASAERQISAINEEEENSSLRNSIKSTSSQSNSKSKDKDEASRSPNKSPTKEEASKRKKDEDLNKVSEDELQRKKAEMDVLFEKNAKRPGDPDFVYDKQIDFDAETHEEPASWDEEGEDEDKDVTKDSSNSEIRTESSGSKNDTQTDVDQQDKTKPVPSKASANLQDDSDGDRSRSSSNKKHIDKDKDKDGDRYDAAFEFDDEDDFEFEAKSKPSSISPSRIPVAKRQFAQSPKKLQDMDEDLPF